MAIIEKFLVPIQTMQNLFVDPNNGEPATGQLNFYVAGTSTPKNAYIYSGDPQNPFVATISLPLTGAGSPNSQVFMYPLNEIDNATPQLYRLSVTNVSAVEIFTKDDYPFDAVTGVSPVVGSGTPANLLPIFGFETKIFSNIFDTQPIPAGRSFVSFGTYWDYQSTNNAEINTYFFNALNDSGIPADPDNSLTIKSTANLTGDTVNQFGWKIGRYSSFQDVQLAFSVYIRKITGAFTDIPMKLIRENSVSGIPDIINIGVLPVTGALVEQTLIFTVPPVTALSHDNADSLNFIFDLPLNEDLEIAMTATWLQESPDGTFAIIEGNTGADLAKSIWQDQYFMYENLYTQVTSGNPVMFRPSGLGFDLDVGKIDLFSRNDAITSHIESRVLMDGTTEFLADKVYEATTTDRYIQYQINSPPLRKSTFTFDVVQIVGVPTGFDISTVLATTHLRPASAVAGGRITHSLVQAEFTMGIKAEYAFRNNSFNFKYLKFTWLTNGAVTSGMYVPTTGGAIASWVVEGPGADSPILANYLGSYAVDFIAGGSIGKYYTNTNGIFVTQGTPTTPADVAFGLGSKNSFLVDHSFNNPTRITEQEDGGDSNTLFNSKVRVFVPGGGGANSTFLTGFLTWQDAATPLPPITTNLASSTNGLYKYVLGFDVENDGAPAVPTAAVGGVRRIIPIASSDSFHFVAQSIIETINNPRIDKFEFDSRPVTGDYLLVDNGKTLFQIIYVETGMANPAPIAGEVPIYVTFALTDTFTQISQNTGNKILNAVAGIPDSKSIGLLSYDSANLSHYVKV